MPNTPSSTERIADLKAQIAAIEQGAIQELMDKRNTLSRELAAVDAEIARLTGKPVEGRKVRSTTPKAAEKSSLTAEITPRRRNDKWTFDRLDTLAKAKFVRVTGWAILDTQHVGKPTPVRKTHWEIHPVTKFEVCTTTKTECDAGTGWVELEDIP